MTKLELAEMLDRFIGDAPGCKAWEWDSFTSVKASPELEPYRQRLLQQGDGWMDTDEIRQVAVEIRWEQALPLDRQERAT